ncbi:septation protein SepH [soil metagenome]
MQDLRVIGTEDGSLLVASDDGTRFRIPIDEALHSKLRQAVPDQGVARKLGPKEIQAHIRSGMSAQDVASITGVPLDYIQRFEGPVIAEREFVVKSALEVPVHTAADTSPMLQGRTFGAAITDRLLDLGGANARWASWKESSNGWIVKLSFTANQIDHDARWQFDPKKQSLAPLNSEAITLSQQGEAAGALMPRLRAVAPTEPSIDSSRFDSGAFAIDESLVEEPAEPVSIGRATPAEDDTPVHGNQTADLLEALRRRRGERESANFDDDEARAAHPSTGSIRIVDSIPFGDEAPAPQRSTQPQPRAGRKGRASMPSWDEIVFGARSDDDPA